MVHTVVLLVLQKEEEVSTKLVFNHGLRFFEISIFEIDSGIDSGRVFDSKRFSYDQFDDIRTSYYKACLLTSSMIINLLKDKNFIKKSFKEQMKNAEYLMFQKSS